MATYRLKIVGVHYAVNPDTALHAEETELMHQRTAQRLQELDEERPRVILMSEPTNPADVRAVMARVRGERIGYVDKTQLDIVHALLEMNAGCPLMACIDEVEARKHGWFFVTLNTSEEVSIAPSQKSEEGWEKWVCNLPTIAPDEAHFARIEAEAVLEELLSKENAVQTCIDDITYYMNLWLRSALHDLSNEARLMREHYIMRLKEMTLQIKVLVSELEKQRTAICGQRRSNLRTGKWWKELVQSAEMQHLWNTWMARIGNNPEQCMSDLDTLLRTLPFDLYAYIDDKKLFFSRLHYSQVPRAKYWQIVSLMLLRERSLMKKTKEPISPTTPITGEAEEKFEVVIPEELQTPEAKKMLAKLQKKGMLDADLQPVGLSNAKKGVLAWELCDHLRIKHCWKLMGILWKCNGDTLRKAREKGIMTDTVIEFTKKIKAIIY
ncbi:MAG: hypothetical protein IKU64_00270 [Bacteroides sp.]|nr:hypothetical protein [Bacteroides sp.]